MEFDKIELNNGDIIRLYTLYSVDKVEVVYKSGDELYQTIIESEYFANMFINMTKSDD